MKKLLLLLLLSLGLIGISYADDSHEDELTAELARQAAESAALEMMAEIEEEQARLVARQRLLEAFLEELNKKAISDPSPTKYFRHLWVYDITAKVKSYWRYQGAEDDWSCEVYVQQDIDGTVEAVNIQNCNTGDSDKARSFKNSIERAVYKASPLPSSPYTGVFNREIQFEFRVN